MDIRKVSWPYVGNRRLVVGGRQSAVGAWLLGMMFALLISSCAAVPKGSFGALPAPGAPDYAKEANWAALPDRVDNADRRPSAGLPDNQLGSAVDVFFLHPTTYTGDKGQKNWNGPVDDPKLNKKTDDGTILYQASIFNGSGRVFAPRYRQAHLKAYFTKDTASAKKAFEVAYADVKAAFQYYLNNHNDGRPIIIATHSQGTSHGMRLIKEFFDGKPLQKRLVAAYLVGIGVPKDYFQYIKPCETPDEIGCFCSWRTYRRGRMPKWDTEGERMLVTNPLLWRIDNTYASRDYNVGGIAFKFEELRPGICDAEVHDGLLWTRRPRFPGVFAAYKQLPPGDYNLFYLNVRENAFLRMKNYIEMKGH
ncbi:MAG: DUF3089 domain-containing protein [Saprospiraceae bacterium]|nr:DUF3089 domain-containing protein [Saprospiraceae bacterium]